MQQASTRVDCGLYEAMKRSQRSGGTDLYGAHYGNFASTLFAEIRAEAFGEDIGQTSWLTAAEQDLFVDWLELSESSSLLDIACGSGGPTLRIARQTGCRVVGIDLQQEGIARAITQAAQCSIATHATFHVADAAERLPFENASFDAVMCIDAINHLADRKGVLSEWRRVLRPEGRLLFTDPLVLTGLITNEELAIRASIGLFALVPPDLDEALLVQIGFAVERVQNRTLNVTENASAWLAARAKREEQLRTIEGDETFEGQQSFLEMTAHLAREQRLSRLAILARRVE